jgi:iron complex transport system substrate-binding protein
VFYQVSWQPLFTVSDRHVIGEAIQLCGGKNAFAELSRLSPAVSLEAVLDANPDVIIAPDFGDRRDEMPTGFSGWAQWDTLPAVRYGNLYLVDADYMARPGLRILEGVRQLCDRLDRARDRLREAATL